MKVKMEGFRELERILAEDLPQSTGRGVLRRVAKAALEPMAAAARSGAPRDQGDLAESIKVSEARTRRAKKEDGAFDRSTGVEIAMGPSSGKGVLNYASFVEFGTVDTRPQPYMRPAWDAGKQAALQHVADNLGAEVMKAAARRARKLAKG